MGTYTISTHGGGGLGSEIHNVDDDFRREVLGYDTNDANFEVWEFTPIQDLYEKRFGEAVQDYNEKQNRSDRKIDDYYDKIVNEEKTGMKKKKEGADNYKHTQYEMIISIGNMEDHPNEQVQKEIYKEFADWFKTNYTQFDINFISYHADEKGNPHLHIGYVPWAEYDKGLKVRNSFSKSLKQMGISTGRGKDLYSLCNQKLQSMCEARGMEIVHPMAGTQSEHLSTSQYKKVKQAEAMMAEVEDEKSKLTTERSSFEIEKENYKSRVNSYFKKQYSDKLQKEKDDLRKANEVYKSELKQEVKIEMATERENLASERLSLNEDIKDLNEAKKLLQEQQRALDELITGSIENYAKIKRPEWVKEYNEYRKNYQKQRANTELDYREQPEKVYEKTR